MAKRKGRASQQPTVYLDTSIPSAYWYEGSSEKVTKRRGVTREWWEAERKLFSVWGSAITEAELRRGVFPRQDECLKMIHRLPYLPVTGKVRRLAVALLQKHVVPESEELDAYHLAIAVVHRMDYLLSWNYAHMVSEYTQEQLAVVCASLDLRTPLMVTPESIPQARFGDDLRREEP